MSSFIGYSGVGHANIFEVSTFVCFIIDVGRWLQWFGGTFWVHFGGKIPEGLTITISFIVFDQTLNQTTIGYEPYTSQKVQKLWNINNNTF